MKFFSFGIFLSFLHCLLPNFSNAQFIISLEKKFNKSGKFITKPTSHYTIKNGSDFLYDSHESGIHFIVFDDKSKKIIDNQVIGLENKEQCSKEIQEKLNISGGNAVLIFCVDNWETCLDLGLIYSLNLSPEAYDLKLLMGAKAGSGHAFVYYSSGKQNYLNISHENNFLGEFEVNLDEYFLTKDKSIGSYRLKRKMIKKQQSKDDFSGRFIETNLTKEKNNSDFYNLTVIQQKMNINVTKNLSTSEKIANISSPEKKAANNNNTERNFYNNSDFNLTKEIKLNLTDNDKPLNSKRRIQKHSNEKNQSFNVTGKKLEIEMISFGAQNSDTDFASIKINQQLIHASRSCGLHVVVIDPCKEKNQNGNEYQNQMALQNLSRFYDELKFLFDKPLKILEISCYDNFRSAKIIDSVFDFTNSEDKWNNFEESVLITCPSMCSFEHDDQKYNPEKLYSLDEEICPNAMKSQIIDDRGGTIFVKAIDTSSADELNMLPKFKIDINHENFKFKMSKYRIPRKIWNFPENITTEIKNAIKLNITSLIQESLLAAEKSDVIDADKMSFLEQKYNFHEDSLSYLPKFMMTYFSEQTAMVHTLESLLEEQKYASYLKVIEQSPIFSSVATPFRNDKMASQSDFYKEKGSGFDMEDIVIFSKTFYICQEYEEIFRGEAYQLTHLLENLSPNWKVLITSVGSWISGLDDSLLQDLIFVGAPELLIQFYKDYKEDSSQNDISLAFIGQFNTPEQKDLAKIEKKSPNQEQFAQYFNPTRVKLRVNLNELEPCANDSNKTIVEQKMVDKNCGSWSCKFFFIFQNKINNLNINLTQYNTSITFDKNNVLNALSSVLSNANTMIAVEQLRINPLSFSQFLFDPPLKHPKQSDSNLSCVLELESNSQDSYSRIKYGNIEKRVSNTNQNNSLLVVIIDNSCQRNFIRSRIFKSTKEDFILLNKFLQEQDPGSVLAFVQYGYFNWAYVMSTTLSYIFQYYGLLDFKDIPDYLMFSNIAFVGKKGLNISGLFSFSLNSKASLNLDLCNNSLFSQCESQVLYIRTMGNNLISNSPMSMRMIVLDNMIVSKNELRGISLTILGCPEEDERNEITHYQKFLEKNFDLWSDGELLHDLNEKLHESIERTYYGTPIFVISTFGNYDYYINDDSENWIEFNFILEKLGGSSFISYLKQKNNIIINGIATDFGHPFIFVGSPKFEKLSAFEYHFDNNSQTSSNQLNVELMIDLNEKKLQCPQPFSKFKALKENKPAKNYEEESANILSTFSSKLNQQMPRILHYDQPTRGFSFKEVLSSNENNKMMFPKLSNNYRDFEDNSSDEAIKALTQEYLKNSGKIIQENQNNTEKKHKNPSLFTNQDHPGTNPCVKIMNVSNHILINHNESQIDQFENFTYNLFIRGLVLGDSIDQIKNFMLKTDYLCDTEVKLYGKDSFDIVNFPENLREIYNGLPLKIYKCQTSNKPPAGEYIINMISQKGNTLHNILGRISRINDLNYELKISFV